jgi:hypothetical protein
MRRERTDHHGWEPVLGVDASMFLNKRRETVVRVRDVHGRGDEGADEDAEEGE